jgi:branched-subunit amino acid aminotransferase/4-amino-4-deoxychorismate lyase
MARAEADSAGAQESLLTNLDGWVVEGAASNLFWIQAGTVCTPPLESGVLPGVTRALILDLCRQLNLVTELRNPTAGQLHQAAGVFMSLSSIGIAQGISLDGKPLGRSDVTGKIIAAYATLMRQPTI